MVRKKKTPSKPPRAVSSAVDLNTKLSPAKLTGSGSRTDCSVDRNSPDLEHNPDSNTVAKISTAVLEKAGNEDEEVNSDSPLGITIADPEALVNGIMDPRGAAAINSEPERERSQPLEQPLSPNTQGRGLPESPNPITDIQNSQPPIGQEKLPIPSERKKTWAECVTGKTGSLQKRGEYYKLPTGATCVTIPNAVISRNKKAWSSFVLGHFHGTLPSMGALHAILNGIWSSKNRDISISRSGEQSILIKIPSPTTRKRVLAQGIWHIEGQSMFVGEWEPGLKPETPELKEVPVWVDFKGVPPHFFSSEGLEYIAGMVGQPLHLHPRTAAMMNLEVARVFTLVDLGEPLPEAVYVRFESGETHKIDVSCQWLPPLCSHCHQYGHSLRRCPTAPITCKICKSTTHEDTECLRTKRKNTNATIRRGSPKPTNRRRAQNGEGEINGTLTNNHSLDLQGAASHQSLVEEASPTSALQLGTAANDNAMSNSAADHVDTTPTTGNYISPTTVTHQPECTSIIPKTNEILNLDATADHSKAIAAHCGNTTNATKPPTQNIVCTSQTIPAQSTQQLISKGNPRDASSEESSSDSDLEDFPKLVARQGGLKKGSASVKKGQTQGKVSKGRGPLARKNL